MSRTINRPSTNITPPTSAHPAAAGLTVQLGPYLCLTDAGVLLAEAVKNAS